MDIATEPPLKKQKRQSSKKPSLSLISSSTSSATTMSCEDIIISILNRLPLKSLIRFMAVSKSWHDMITNPHRPESCYSFRMSLSSASLPTRHRLLGFFINKKRSLIKYIPYSHMNDSGTDACHRFLEASKYPRLRVVASSKGILLCTNDLGCAPRLFYVCNPLTGQKVQLPLLHKHVIYNSERIRFNCQVVVNGVSDVVMQYVVMVTVNDHVYVFSSLKRGRSRRWRKLSRKESEEGYLSSTIIHAMPAVITAGEHQKDISTVTCNEINEQGSYSGRYWRIKSPVNYLYTSASDIHLGTRRNFRNIDSPPRLDRICYGGTLKPRNEIQVWVYKIRTNSDGNGDHWKLKHTVRLQDLLEMYPEKFESAPFPYGCMLQFEGFHPCLPGIVFFRYRNKFFSYRFKNKKLKLHSRSCHYDSYDPVDFIPFEWSPWPYLLS